MARSRMAEMICVPGLGGWRFHFLVDRLKAKAQRTQYPYPNSLENIAIMQQAMRKKLGR